MGPFDKKETDAQRACRLMGLKNCDEVANKLIAVENGFFEAGKHDLIFDLIEAYHALERINDLLGTQHTGQDPVEAVGRLVGKVAKLQLELNEFKEKTDVDIPW